jgi:hypothetical protein
MGRTSFEWNEDPRVLAVHVPHEKTAPAARVRVEGERNA